MKTRMETTAAASLALAATMGIALFVQPTAAQAQRFRNPRRQNGAVTRTSNLAWVVGIGPSQHPGRTRNRLLYLA